MTTTATALGPVVDVLVAVPVRDLCVTELQGRIASVGRQVDRLDGWLSAAAGELQARTGGSVPTEDGGSRTVCSWLAEQRRESPSTVGSALKTSAALRTLPLVTAAVLDGVLTLAQAAVLARLVGRIDEPFLREAEPDLVLVAAGRSPAELGQYVSHLIATHCEPALDEDTERTQVRRFLQTSREADGSLRGRFLLPAGDAEAFLAVSEALARRQGLADSRTAGQRRADALVEVHEQALRHGELPEHGGHRPQVSYVLPAGWAARQADRVQCPTCTCCAEHRVPSFADTVATSLPGHPGVPAEHACAVGAWTGPSTRAHIETVLCDARLSRVLLDSLGQVRGLESLTDTVTKTQRRALAARDGACAARGCTRPPAMCDAHHLVGLAHDGATALGNLVLLCRRHHVLWHLGKTTLRDLHVPWHPDARGTGPPAS
jgi:hypothetical protein